MILPVFQHSGEYYDVAQPSAVLRPAVSALTLSNPEHLGPACGAYTLGCWFAILHRYGPSVLHFPLGTTFHTVGLHRFTSFLLGMKSEEELDVPSFLRRPLFSHRRQAITPSTKLDKTPVRTPIR